MVRRVARTTRHRAAPVTCRLATGRRRRVAPAIRRRTAGRRRAARAPPPLVSRRSVRAMRRRVRTARVVSRRATGRRRVRGMPRRVRAARAVTRRAPGRRRSMRVMPRPTRRRRAARVVRRCTRAGSSRTTTRPRPTPSRARHCSTGSQADGVLTDPRPPRRAPGSAERTRVCGLGRKVLWQPRPSCASPSAPGAPRPGLAHPSASSRTPAVALAPRRRGARRTEGAGVRAGRRVGLRVLMHSSSDTPSGLVAPSGLVTRPARSRRSAWRPRPPRRPGRPGPCPLHARAGHRAAVAPVTAPRSPGSVPSPRSRRPPRGAPSVAPPDDPVEYHEHPVGGPDRPAESPTSRLRVAAVA